MIIHPFLRALLSGLTVAAFAVDAADIDSRQVIPVRDEFQFTYRVKLPVIDGRATLWLPLGQSDAFQLVEVEQICTPGIYERVRDFDHGNQVLIFYPRKEDSGKLIEITYAVKRLEKSAYPTGKGSQSAYLRPELLVPRDKTFTDLARAATQGARSSLDKGRALYQHTLDRMKYDKSGEGWGRGDAHYACDAKTGNCTDFHAYFIALARSIGLPARFSIGYTIPADSDEGAIGGYHCWAEFQADGQWIPVDISEADKFPALADYYFGHHPANRFELTTGRDLLVDPLPQSGPINFLVYPLLEVDGKLVKTENTFSFKRTKVAGAE